jgi:hypothetical protein
MYKSFGLIVVLLLGFFTTGCGSNSNSNINGTWTANHQSGRFASL